MRKTVWICSLLAGLWLVACNKGTGDSQSPVTDNSDARSEAAADASSEATTDAQSEAVTDGESEAATDTRPEEEGTDVGPEDSASWSISGQCGVLDDEEWLSSQPFFFRNNMDFGAIGYDEDLLSDGARKIATSQNAGGSSEQSEALSFELLNRCEGAELIKIETEIDYQDSEGKITDILVEIDNRYVGVSVTRSMAYTGECTYDSAYSLLEKKLTALPLSQANAVEADQWERSILYILAQDENCADVMAQAFNNMDDDIKGDAIVMVTVSDGTDGFLYNR